MTDSGFVTGHLPYHRSRSLRKDNDLLGLSERDTCPADHVIERAFAGAAFDGWERRIDTVSRDLVSAFFDESRYFELPRAVRQSVTFSTRIGGVPQWLQSPAEAPNSRDGWKFTAQLDSTYSFLQAPTVRVDWISTDGEGYEGRTHVAVGPNFGDGGIAYVFLRDTGGLPEGVVFSQCG